jgi:FkbM family methyltransferase
MFMVDGDISFAQEGEDMVLRRLFEGRKGGFYVDIGAHHPRRFSNTYYFYRRGWSGINVDAMPGAMAPFRRIRPRDINVEAAIGSPGQTLTYTMYDEPAVNTMSSAVAGLRVNQGRYSPQGKTQLQTRSLESILSEYARGRKIDFLTVDVEGLDYEVLKSNNWDVFRPEYVLAESLEEDGWRSGDVAELMKTNKYEVIAKCVNTIFFRDRSNAA